MGNQSNQPNKERRGARGDKKESSSRGNDSPPAEPGTPTGRLMPWEQELLIQRAEEEALALGKVPPAPEVILARARGEEIPDPVAEPSTSPDPDVWGPPLANKAKPYPAKKPAGGAKPSMGSAVAAAEGVATVDAKTAKDLKGQSQEGPLRRGYVPGTRSARRRRAPRKRRRAAAEAAAADAAMKREAAAAERRTGGGVGSRRADQAPGRRGGRGVWKRPNRRLRRRRKSSIPRRTSTPSRTSPCTSLNIPEWMPAFRARGRRRRPRRTPPWLRCSRGLPSRLPSSGATPRWKTHRSRRRLPRR